MSVLPEVLVAHRRIAQELIARGNALRDGDDHGITDALSAYQEAIDCLTPSLAGAAEPGYRDDLASAWTNQGIALMLRADPEALKSALACFERAIELREALLGFNDPWFRYNLAGVWINKGDLLLRLDPAGVPGPLASYERAAEILKDAPIGRNPLFCRRLALAWFNRGIALLQTNDAAGRREAIHSFTEAIQAAAACAGDGAVDTLAAAAWANKADALRRENLWDGARAAALRAIALAAAREKQSADPAMIGLRGRIALCLTAARFFAARVEDPLKEERISEAIEAAEEGLRIAGQWKAQARFAPLTQELFRLGGEAYACWQPHFLVEFLDENLPLARSVMPPGEADRLAAHVIALAIAQVARESFPTLNQPGIERSLATFRQLRQAADRLRQPAG